jgi:HSP20 family molecular chaperone IbpA
MSKRQRAIGNVVLCENEQPLTGETDVVQERIRARAFEISLKRGHAGREVDDWLTAESDVIMSPPVEVAEKGGALIVRMPAAGVDPKELTIMATRDRLLVKADFRHDHEPDAEIHSCEFKSIMLFRSIPLPKPIDLAGLGIRLDDGILRITARCEGAKSVAVMPKPARKKVAAKKKKAS